MSLFAPPLEVRPYCRSIRALPSNRPAALGLQACDVANRAHAVGPQARFLYPVAEQPSGTAGPYGDAYLVLDGTPEKDLAT